ncbi:MAG: hypothetical protein M1820_005939 [Bogoriella megaspora]|nr:MAG: hypothetical protein M1820_005939 [Bogoriella megaspora]
MARILFILTTFVSLAATGLCMNNGQQNNHPNFQIPPPATLATSTKGAQPTKGVSPNNSTTNGTTSPPKKYTHFDCGTNANHASDHFMSTVSDLHSEQGPKGAPGARERSLLPKRDFSANIDTYFHVITKSDSAGTITKDMATKQISAMNSAYSPVGLTFTLKDTDFTVNDAWAVGAGSDDANMKTALRKGGYAALNIYFQTDLDGSILGNCALPTNITDPLSYIIDGCNVNAGTMPGGQIQGYDQGMTAAHETGHWLGLLHTFEGYACDGDGDFIADTPMESVSTDGCPTSPTKDSCPNQPGDDPIHNFMDYSTDACYTGFTDGQIARIQTMWGQYRQGK